MMSKNLTSRTSGQASFPLTENIEFGTQPKRASILDTSGDIDDEA